MGLCGNSLSALNFIFWYKICLYETETKRQFVIALSYNYMCKQGNFDLRAPVLARVRIRIYLFFFYSAFRIHIYYVSFISFFVSFLYNKLFGGNSKIESINPIDDRPRSCKERSDGVRLYILHIQTTVAYSMAVEISSLPWGDRKFPVSLKKLQFK